ncbi:hypothetical protein B0H14DRAFT_3061807, partial [Mycena olivaceomarginata]
MQAILRWQRDNAPDGERQPRPVLSLVRKHQLLQAVRELQRCRHISRWHAYTTRFRRRLDVIADGSPTSAETLWDYFEANWLCEEWRDLWTDMGLPEGSNRDGMLSTNNWTERGFKTFNQIFLGNRTNKSAYRLVLILANEWFQYYQAWPATKRVNHDAWTWRPRPIGSGAAQMPFRKPNVVTGVERGMLPGSRRWYGGS